MRRNPPKAPYRPRRPRQEDVSGWMSAADRRQPTRTVEGVRAALLRKNSYRMWRVARDVRWLKRQLRKMGVNPEDYGSFL